MSVRKRQTFLKGYAEHGHHSCLMDRQDLSVMDAAAVLESFPRAHYVACRGVEDSDAAGLENLGSRAQSFREFGCGIENSFRTKAGVGSRRVQEVKACSRYSKGYTFINPPVPGIQDSRHRLAPILCSNTRQPVDGVVTTLKGNLSKSYVTYPFRLLLKGGMMDLSINCNYIISDMKRIAVLCGSRSKY